MFWKELLTRLVTCNFVKMFCPSFPLMFLIRFGFRVPEVFLLVLYSLLRNRDISLFSL